MKKIRVIFSAEAEEVYNYLNEEAPHSKREESILSAIHKKVELIKANAHYGNPISKKLIPKEYELKYGATNLFRVELPSFWRMLYTLADGESEIEIIAFVIDVMDHKAYDKKLGYKGR